MRWRFRSRYRPWRSRIIAMLPPDQNARLAEFEQTHGRAAQVRCRQGRFTAHIGNETLPLETLGDRAQRKRKEHG